MKDLNNSLREYLGKNSEEYIIATLMSLMTLEEQEECQVEPRLGIGYRLSRGDLLSIKGFKAMGVHKPLMIEVKASLLINTFNKQLKVGEEYLSENRDHLYWVVYLDTRLSLEEDVIIGNVRFLSLSYIKRAAKEYYRIHDIDYNDSSQEFISKVPRPTQEEIIENAIYALSTRPTSFMLGAGISVDAGAESWNSLLQGIMKDLKHLDPIGQRNSDYDNVNGKCGWSPLITARYVVDNVDSSKVETSMRKNLYANSKGAGKYNTAPTALPVIAKLIKRAKSECAITFNYDCYLEEALSIEGVLFSSVYDKGSLNSNVFPIYHVHGLIDRNQSIGKSIKPVLSEREYHLLYSNDFHWSNVEILHALTRNSCFLVGLSMTDPNLRRLLDISKLDDDGEPRHFVFMRREPLDPKNPDKLCDQKHWEHMEDQFRSMGLNIIWFDYNDKDKDDFKDLARKLEKIYSGLLDILTT